MESKIIWLKIYVKDYLYGPEIQRCNPKYKALFADLISFSGLLNTPGIITLEMNDIKRFFKQNRDQIQSFSLYFHWRFGYKTSWIKASLKHLLDIKLIEIDSSSIYIPMAITWAQQDKKYAVGHSARKFKGALTTHYDSKIDKKKYNGESDHINISDSVSDTLYLSNNQERGCGGKPSLEEVIDFFKKNELDNPEKFFEVNEGRNWKDASGNPIKEWKSWAKVCNQNNIKNKQGNGNTENQQGRTLQSYQKYKGKLPNQL